MPAVALSPVPLKLTTVELPVDELLEMVNCPVAVPAAVGANVTVSAIDLAELNVTGNAAPDMLKPVPLTDTESTVTAELPVEVRVSAAVTVLLRVTLPNATLPELTARVGTLACT